MHELYVNNGENSVNDILASHNMSINYFFYELHFHLKGEYLAIRYILQSTTQISLSLIVVMVCKIHSNHRN